MPNFDDFNEKVKVTHLRQEIKENAGEGVYSLRLFDTNRRSIVNKLNLVYFELNDSIKKNSKYANLLLPIVEEMLQNKLKPVAGRYRA